MRRFFRVFLASAIALTAPAVLADDSKKEEEEHEKKKKGKPREDEEKKREEEEKKRREAAEENWDDRNRGGNCPWPEPPDLGEMFERAKRGGACAGEEPKPDVGGYRKAPSNEDVKAAEAAGGAFGEGEAKKDRGEGDGKKENGEREEKEKK
jgi:hypothetical protein